MDSTDTLTINSGDLNVSFVTPLISPRVSDDVEIFAVLGSITNGHDSVIKLKFTFGTAENSACVALEDVAVGIEGDGNWLFVNSSLKLSDGASWDVRVALDVDNSLWHVGVAVSEEVEVDIWVVCFKVLGVCLQVFESVGLQSTVASLILTEVFTIDELLLGKFQKGSGLEEMFSFVSSSSREGPA